MVKTPSVVGTSDLWGANMIIVHGRRAKALEWDNEAEERLKVQFVDDSSVGHISLSEIHGFEMAVGNEYVSLQFDGTLRCGER